MLRSLRRCKNLIQDRAGNVAVLFSIGAPLLILAGGGSIDYLRTLSAKASLQALADGAALAGAQSLRLANANAASVGQVVSGFVASRAGATGNVAVASNLTTNNTVVAVQLTQTVPTVIAHAVGLGPTNVVAKAQAKNAGNSLPVCVVGLDPAQSKTIAVDVATMNAQGCQVLSDATATDSVSISNGAKMNVGRLCSSGGARSDGTSNYSPAPQTDCPPLVDPLANRAAPTVGSCFMNNLKITAGPMVLLPGTYCGGLEISGSATVFMMGGVYVMKDGPLTVKAGGTLQGSDVSIYLASDDATLQIANSSNISLSAPATGPMAGILIFENRAAPLYRNHNFQSRNAPNMLGTIYMPRGILNIGVGGGGGSGGVAVGANSAWTIIVARRLQVTDNQQLNLNTNYSSTNVPPPAGLGPNATYGLSTQLVN